LKALIGTWKSKNVKISSFYAYPEIRRKLDWFFLIIKNKESAALFTLAFCRSMDRCFGRFSRIFCSEGKSSYKGQVGCNLTAGWNAKSQSDLRIANDNWNLAFDQIAWIQSILVAADFGMKTDYNEKIPQTYLMRQAILAC
jgi:hypothetical protein